MMLSPRSEAGYGGRSHAKGVIVASSLRASMRYAQREVDCRTGRPAVLVEFCYDVRAAFGDGSRVARMVAQAEKSKAAKPPCVIAVPGFLGNRYNKRCRKKINVASMRVPSPSLAPRKKKAKSSFADVIAFKLCRGKESGGHPRTPRRGGGGRPPSPNPAPPKSFF